MKIDIIVEYADLDAHHSERGDTVHLFDSYSSEESPYWNAVIERLKNSYGMYIFYDSLTRPLYVGIAVDQTIYKRATQSYNKYRDRNGKIMEVNHPASGTYDSKRTRPVRRTGFSLVDVATYFSAYEVEEKYISGLEAFAIRAFGGVLLNTKMEGNGGFGLAKVGAEE